MAAAAVGTPQGVAPSSDYLNVLGNAGVSTAMVVLVTTGVFHAIMKLGEMREKAAASDKAIADAAMTIKAVKDTSNAAIAVTEAKLVAIRNSTDATVAASKEAAAIAITAHKEAAAIIIAASKEAAASAIAAAEAKLAAKERAANAVIAATEAKLAAAVEVIATLKARKVEPKRETPSSELKEH